MRASRVEFHSDSESGNDRGGGGDGGGGDGGGDGLDQGQRQGQGQGQCCVESATMCAGVLRRIAAGECGVASRPVKKPPPNAEPAMTIRVAKAASTRTRGDEVLDAVAGGGTGVAAGSGVPSKGVSKSVL